MIGEVILSVVSSMVGIGVYSCISRLRRRMARPSNVFGPIVLPDWEDSRWRQDGSCQVRYSVGYTSELCNSKVFWLGKVAVCPEHGVWIDAIKLDGSLAYAQKVKESYQARLALESVDKG